MLEFHHVGVPPCWGTISFVKCRRKYAEALVRYRDMLVFENIFSVWVEGRGYMGYSRGCRVM